MAEGAGRNVIRINNDADAFRECFNVETQLMAREGYYSANEDFKALRQRCFAFIVKNSEARGEDFDPSIPYMAMNYFDRFISRYEIPTVIESAQENNNLFVICCLTITLKRRKKEISKFLIHGSLCYQARNVLDMEMHICVRLEWRLRTPMPFLFAEYFISLVYLPVESDPLRFRESIQMLILRSQADIAYTAYRPSCVAASALLAVVSDKFPGFARAVEFQLQSSEFLNGNLDLFVNCSKRLKQYSDLDEISRSAAQPATILSSKETRENKENVLRWETVEQKLKAWLAANSRKDANLIEMNEMIAETIEPSEDLIIPLYGFQKQWLAWALRQEKFAVKGGILADEMGMGKTLQAIALVLLQRKNRVLSGLAASSSSHDMIAVKATLVICPLVAMKQWECEIECSTVKGSTKVLLYHGIGRLRDVAEFGDYDFVLTTYKIVETEYRKYVMQQSECQYCGKFFYDHKLKNHIIYNCGPHARQTQREERNPKKMSKTEGKSILHYVKWERIILDEVQYIKGRTNNTTRAVVSLKSTFRWGLSGTPVQNDVGDLYSLVWFLQIMPYSYFYCKDCECCMLDNGPSTQCCGHKYGRHFCWWDKYVMSPLKGRRNAWCSSSEAAIFLKHCLLKAIMMRRIKNSRAAKLDLPLVIYVVRRCTLDEFEEDYYKALQSKCQAKFDIYRNAGTSSYDLIFDLMMRLRQAANHPYLVELSLEGTEKCSLCDSEEDTVVTSCAHVFCRHCLTDSGQNSCPSCSEPVVDFVVKEKNTRTAIKGFRPSSILNRIKLDRFQTSTKIEALREEIRFMLERDGSAKGIVFSQFSPFLDLIQYALEMSGVDCLHIDGYMSKEERDATVAKFTEDPKFKIFLTTFKAGGVALNLTAASHVFLMDPWWNSAVEQQALGRIHRIGQSKPCRMVRFIAENTVEERVWDLKENKSLLFEGTLEKLSDLTKIMW